MQPASFGRRALVAWVEFVRRRAVPVLIAAVALTAVLLAVTVSTISVNTSTEDMLSPELPFRKNAAALKEAFPQLRNRLTVVVESDRPERANEAAERLAAHLRAETSLFRDVFFPEGDPFFRRNGLLYLSTDELYDLSDRLAQAEPMLAALNADPSLRGLADVLALALEEGEAGSGDLAATFGPVLARMAAAVETLSAGTPEPLSWQAVLDGNEAANNEGDLRERRFIIVQTIPNFGSLSPVAGALRAIHQAATDLDLTAEHGLRVRVTGSAAMLQDELSSLRDSMGLVGALSVLLVIGFLALGLRSGRLLLSTVATLLMGLVWTAGFAALAIGELNLISVAFAVLFIGLSVDFGIHFSLRYREALVSGEPLGGALARAADGVGGALALSAVAAAIGFFSFLPTDYRGVSELGLISGGGMFIALFANLTVLPACLALMPLRNLSGQRAWSLGDRVQTVVRGHFRKILLAGFALAVVAALALPLARFDDDPLNLRDPNSDSVATLLDLLDDPRFQPYDAEFLAADLEKAQALAEKLRDLPEVKSVRTIADYVPKEQDDKLLVVEDMAFFLGPVFTPQAAAVPSDETTDRAAVEKLRAALSQAPAGLAEPAAAFDRALADLHLSAATLTSLTEILLSDLPQTLEKLGDALGADVVALEDVPESLRSRRLAEDGRATVQIIPREDLRDQEARRRFVDAVRAEVPGLTGAPVTITEAGRAVVTAFREAAVYAIVLIALLLLAVLRSLRDTAMVLAPLALAALLTVAFTVVFGTPFNFANVIVLPLLFGLGVASGIHIVVRSRRDAGSEVLETSTPRAVTFSALTTIGSFGALALSSHRGTASMGLLLTVAIGMTLLCTLIVLPALLEAARRRDARRDHGGSH